MSPVEQCVCGASLGEALVEAHPYVPATPGCWEAFGLLQADEYERFGYSDQHGTMVDAYMASHPDPADPRNRRSVALHLAGLQAVLESGFSPTQRIALLQGLAHREMPAIMWDEPPAMTVEEMLFPDDQADLAVRTHRWATAVWQAWADEQGMIRELVRSVS